LFSDLLTEAGFKLNFAPLFNEDYIHKINTGKSINIINIGASYLRRVIEMADRTIDILWIEKEVLPYAPPAFERILCRGRRIVLDLDDAWHLRYQRPCVPRVLASKIEAGVRCADHVIVANHRLEAWAAAAGAKNIDVVPTGLDTSAYPVAPEPNGPFTLGWIGGPFTVPYLGLIAEPLRRLSQEGARLIVVGEVRPIPALAGITIEQYPWDEASESDVLSRCHVGLAPLPDDNWTRFKSGYKLVQYMAAGRPAVASPVGANADILVDGETGFFADTPTIWEDRLRALAAQPLLRARLGAAARRRCDAVFSHKVLGARIADIMTAVTT
jgi:glycosyltransferase involved in cell wall biosynthesis